LLGGESDDAGDGRRDLYIATGRLKHGESAPCPRGPLPKNATLTDRMRRKLQTKSGKNVYRWRKAIVEPVFGQIKHARGSGNSSYVGWRRSKASGLSCAWGTTC